MYLEGNGYTLQSAVGSINGKHLSLGNQNLEAPSHFPNSRIAIVSWQRTHFLTTLASLQLLGNLGNIHPNFHVQFSLCLQIYTRTLTFYAMYEHTLSLENFLQLQFEEK